MVKALIRSVLKWMGYDLVPARRRDSTDGVLANLARNGLVPATVIDVGAAFGDFARTASRHFPEARLVLVEPLADYGPALKSTLADLPRARLVQAAASNQAGPITFHVHEDLVGSSLLGEAEGDAVDGQPREVDCIRLDDALVNDPGPYLLKADVQGAERAVLEGAEGLLGDCAAVILETSFVEFFDGGPLAHDLIAWMEGQGFRLHDLFGLAHRPLDGALAQADLVFVPVASPLRSEKAYARPDQRAALTAAFRAKLKARGIG
ncbi:MAG: FkbM family methyltransferase [Rhodospirillales bacterium]